MDMVILTSWQVIAAAFALDLIIGDPEGWPHPIRLMGAAISENEKRFRRLPLHATISGGLFAISLILGTFGIAYGLLHICSMIHPGLKAIAEVVIIYFCLSARCLEKAAWGIEKPLSNNDQALARQKISMIVSRETKDLSQTQICRATVETVAENFVDGVLSPLFFIVIGGAPGAMAYKMINTLDSMVGYKNEKYLLFGKVAARIDDGANFIPARLSAPIIAFSARIMGLDGRRSLKTAFLEGRNHKSPNAGYPEAAFAGALGVRLNGPNVYHGRLVDKPFIGTGFSDPKPKDITMARGLLIVSSLIGMLVAAGIFFIFH